MGAEIFTLFGRIVTNAGQTVGELGRVDSAAAKTGAAMSLGFAKANAAIQRNAGAIRAVGVAFTAGGAAVAASLFGMGRAAATFEEPMRNVDSILKLSTAGFASMSGAVVELSTRLPQSAATLAAGLYDIASSGFEGADALTVLEASAKAASAGVSDTATAAKAIAGALNAYGMSAGSAGHVSDVLFKTVDRGVISFSELAGGIGEVLASAAAVGVPLEEVGAAIATMTKAGIPAAQTMTSLNRIMVTFLNPPKELAEALAKVTDESALQIIQTKGLAGAVEILNEVTGNSPELLAAIGLEQRSLKAAMSLTREEGAPYRQELALQAKAAGATQAALERQAEGFNYQFGLMKNQMSAAAIGIGQHLLPALRPLVDLVGRIAKGVAAWVKEHPSLTRGLALSAAAVAGLMLALGPLLIALPALAALYVAWTVKAAAAAVAQTTLNAATVGGGAVGWLGRFGGALGSVARVGGPLALLAVGLYAAAKAWERYYLKSREGRVTALGASIAGDTRLLNLLEMERSAAEAWQRAVDAGDKELAATLLKQVRYYQGLAQAAAAGGVGAGAGDGKPTPGVPTEKRTALELSQAYGALLKAKVDYAAADADDEQRVRDLRDYIAWLTIAAETWGGLAQKSKDPALWEWATELKTRLVGANEELFTLARGVARAASETLLASAQFDTRLDDVKAGIAEATNALDRLTRLGYAGTVPWENALRRVNELLDEQLGLQAQLGISRREPEAAPMDLSGMLPPIPESVEDVRAALERRLGELQQAWDTASVARRETIKQERAVIEGQLELLEESWDDSGRQVGDDWVNVVRGIHDSFVAAFDGMLNRTGGFFEKFFAGIEQAFNQLIAHMVADWLFGIDQMQKTGQAGGVLGGIFNALAGALGGGGTAGPSVEAYGEALDLMDAIPTFAAGGIVTRPTLAVVGEVPEVIAPLSQVAAAGAGAPVTVHLTIQAIDTRTGVQFLMENQRAVANAVQAALRGNAPLKRERS
ncbi:MAG TPA: phage tail tape measure protein [Armatimonadota bacterium]|nr:phage tail tape measure protein [Armatimonadota bacterium]